MTYESFQDQRNKLWNLYDVIRKSDGKYVLRGASYNSVIDLIRDDEGNYLIFFY